MFIRDASLHARRRPPPTAADDTTPSTVALAPLVHLLARRDVVAAKIRGTAGTRRRGARTTVTGLGGGRRGSPGGGRRRPRDSGAGSSGTRGLAGNRGRGPARSFGGAADIAAVLATCPPAAAPRSAAWSPRRSPASAAARSGTLRAAASPTPTDRIVPLSPKMVGLGFQGGSPAAGVEDVTAHSARAGVQS